MNQTPGVGVALVGKDIFVFPVLGRRAVLRALTYPIPGCYLLQQNLYIVHRYANN
ncbi:hypothetical protein JW935_14720 [candidate division KSB1 bacterium]|nr:hypothetical protein [candidate division KSB1 bacterium]